MIVWHYAMIKCFMIVTCYYNLFLKTKFMHTKDTPVLGNIVIKSSKENSTDFFTRVRLFFQTFDNLERLLSYQLDNIYFLWDNGSINEKRLLAQLEYYFDDFENSLFDYLYQHFPASIYVDLLVLWNETVDNYLISCGTEDYIQAQLEITLSTKKLIKDIRRSFKEYFGYY